MAKTAQEVMYNCLDPRGNHSDVQLHSPAERLKDLNGKTVYFVDIGKKIQMSF